MAIAIFRINYKSDFILTLNSDAGWATPFCIKFWTGAPSQAYFVGFDGTTYTHCAPVEGEPTKLRVQFDDHHLPIGDLKFQIGYHFTVADFPTSVEDEVLNQASVIIEVDDAPAQVMLDFNGETAPEIQFTLPAYTNEQQRIANEEQRIENEQQRIANEETRQENEAQRIRQETARVNEYAELKADAVAATKDANDAAVLATQKAGLADDAATLAAQKAGLANDAAALATQKAGLADDAATLATQKAGLANDAAALAAQKAGLANDAATLANQKAQYAQDQGDYAKAQGDYAKAQANVIPADVTRTQTDATFVNGNHDSLFYLRQANSSLAGLMTAAGYTKLNDMPSVQEVNAGLAYDVSVLHPTSGVNGGSTYASLSAALAVIPQDKRKGGMTVKFVQSSDNNYVKFFCTANEFTTDVTKWQGVDDEPTAGSNNLVKSGGTADSIADSIGIYKSVKSTTNVSGTEFRDTIYGNFKNGDKLKIIVNCPSNLFTNGIYAYGSSNGTDLTLLLANIRVNEEAYKTLDRDYKAIVIYTSNAQSGIIGDVTSAVEVLNKVNSINGDFEQAKVIGLYKKTITIPAITNGKIGIGFAIPLHSGDKIIAKYECESIPAMQLNYGGSNILLENNKETSINIGQNTNFVALRETVTLVSPDTLTFTVILMDSIVGDIRSIKSDIISLNTRTNVLESKTDIIEKEINHYSIKVPITSLQGNTFITLPVVIAAGEKWTFKWSAANGIISGNSLTVWGSAPNDPAGKNFGTFSNGVSKTITVPVYDSITEYIGVTLYITSSKKLSTGDIILEAIKLPIESFDYHLPSKIYGIDNVSETHNHTYGVSYPYSREYATTIYQEGIVGEHKIIDVNGKNYFNFPALTDIGNGNKKTETVSLKLGGNGNYDEVTENISFVRLKNSIAKNKSIRFLSIGDSITASILRHRDGIIRGDFNYPSIIKSLFTMDNADFGEDDISALTLGTMRQYKDGTWPNLNDYTLPYKEQNYPIRTCCEGRGSWGACHYLRHAIYSVSQQSSMGISGKAAWDALGLGRRIVGITSTYDDTLPYNQYVDNEANRYLITRTCYGYYHWDYSSELWNALIANDSGFSLYYPTRVYMRNLFAGEGGYIGSAAQKEKIDTAMNYILDHPDNPFYDKATAAAHGADTIPYAFSLAGYLSKWKTLDDDGETRLIVGDTAGSMINDNEGIGRWGKVDYIDVCTPTHVIIELGTNDAFWAVNPDTERDENGYSKTVRDAKDAILKMMDIIHTEYPDIYVGFACVKTAGVIDVSKWPSGVQEWSSNYPGFLYKLNKYVEESISAISGNTKIYSIPTYCSMSPISVRDLINKVFLADGSMTPMRSTDDSHQGLDAHWGMAYQIYGWILDTLS